MRKTRGSSIVVCLSLLASPALGQDEGAGITLIHCLDIQPGAEAKFEEAWGRHIDWHRKQKDPWTWAAWEVMTGPETGRFCAGTFGHKWDDFDKPGVAPEADYADARVTFWPYVKKHEATYWAHLPKVSRPAAEPAAMSSVVFFHVRFGKDDEFNHLVGEFHKAIAKTEMPWKYDWYALASGGEGGTYALVLPRPDFASFNPTGKPFDEMLEEAYGRQAADALLARWEKVVERTENHLVRGRPDRGYVPEP